MTRGRQTWFGTRRVLAALALAGHLFAALGVPLPSPRAKEASGPYPCQGRPCGCLTAEACWAGDCCCFTLEQKLAWAEANGVEPPPHVRPLVESREAKAPPAGEPCCCEDAAPCCASKKLIPPIPSHRWVVGVFAARCAGADPAALEAEPAIPPAPPAPPAAPAFVGYVPAVAEAAVTSVLLTAPPPPRN